MPARAMLGGTSPGDAMPYGVMPVIPRPAEPPLMAAGQGTVAPAMAPQLDTDAPADLPKPRRASHLRLVPDPTPSPDEGKEKQARHALGSPRPKPQKQELIDVLEDVLRWSR